MLLSDHHVGSASADSTDSDDAPTRALPGADAPATDAAGALAWGFAPGPARAKRAPELTTGSVVGRFMLIGKLGAGGLGVVHRAYDRELDRKVAIKLLRTDRISAAEDAEAARARLLREARAGARISHPNVAQVYDVGLVDGRVFLAIEFIEGVTLRAWLKEQKRSIPAIVEVFVQVARGLAAAHEQGLLHRDLKPDNIMVTLKSALLR